MAEETTQGFPEDLQDECFPPELNQFPELDFMCHDSEREELEIEHNSRYDYIQEAYGEPIFDEGPYGDEEPAENVPAKPVVIQPIPLPERGNCRKCGTPLLYNGFCVNNNCIARSHEQACQLLDDSNNNCTCSIPF